MRSLVVSLMKSRWCCDSLSASSSSIGVDRGHSWSNRPGGEYPRVTRLVAAGFGASTAGHLVDNRRDEFQRQLDVLPSRDLSSVRDRVAWLRRVI